MNRKSDAPGLLVLAAGGLIFAVPRAEVIQPPHPGAPAAHHQSQERRIQRSIPISDALAGAYAEGTRSPGGSPGPNYWQLQVDYVIHATLDPPTSVVTARESIVLHNTSEEVLDAVRMRFDQNLFREDAASRMDIPNHTEGMVVTSLSIDGAAMFVPAGPETTRRFPLARPLAPADSIRIDVEWHFEVPLDDRSSSLRMGRWADSVYQVAQWYPRVAVYDDLMGWDTASYDGLWEFHNNFGRFEVFVDVPAGWLVGATGTLLNDPRADATERAVWHFVADTVRDFAWAASDRYEWQVASANIPGRGEVPVHLFRTAATAAGDPGLDERVSEYLEVYSRLLVPYSFPSFTVVEGPEGGMEYPGLIMSAGDGRLAHEVAHQWFPMTVGSDETRFTFMDEGLANAMPSLLSSPGDAEPETPNLGRQYGPSTRLARFPALLPGDDPDSQMTSYWKPEHMLRMLGGVVGDNVMWRAIGDYAAAWRFKHPSPWDLMAFVSNAVERDLGWFWYYWLFTHAGVEGSVAGVEPDGQGGKVTVRQDGAMPSPVVLAIQCAPGGAPARLPGSGYVLDESTVVVTRPVDVWFPGARELTFDLDIGCEIGRVTWDPARRFPDQDACDNVWPRGSRPLFVQSWPPGGWGDAVLVCN